MVQGVKCFPDKPEYNPRIHIEVEEENQFMKLSSDLQTSHTVIINNFKSSLCKNEVKQNKILKENWCPQHEGPEALTGEGNV